MDSSRWSMSDGAGGPVGSTKWTISLSLLGEVMRQGFAISFVRGAAVLLAASSLSSAAFAAEPATATAAATPSVPAHPRLGAWGFDMTGRDLSVKPGNDFEKYASGNWLARTQIAPDKPEVSSFYDLFDRSQDQLKELITNAPANSEYGVMYKSMMDEAAVEAAGLTPLKADLAKVDAIKTKSEFAQAMGAAIGDFGSSIFAYDLEPDTGDAKMNALYLYQSGLGMPNRDYYLKPEFKTQRDAYRAYIERTFRNIGTPNPAAAADRVMAFETAIAKVSWASADRRDIDKTNNPMSSAALAKYAPGIDWHAFFDGAKVPSQKRMIVNENTAIKKIAALYARTPLSTLRDWQAFHTTDQASPYLNKAMVDSRFDYVKSI